jgi:hypothetical protein
MLFVELIITGKETIADFESVRSNLKNVKNNKQK